MGGDTTMSSTGGQQSPDVQDEGGDTAAEIFSKLRDAEEAKKQRLLYRLWTSYFDPTKQPRKGWDVFMIFCVLYSGFMTPYKAVFTRLPEAAPEQDAEDWVIDCLFYLDIILNFWTGFDNGYKIEGVKAEIAKNYVYGFFWVRPLILFLRPRRQRTNGPGFFDFFSVVLCVQVDLIATVQWDMLVNAISGGTTDVASLALLKLLKVARMLRFGRLIARLRSHWKVHTGYVEATKFFIYVIYVAHILSCLFFLWSELFDCHVSTCTGTADDGTVCTATNLLRDACPAGCDYDSYEYPPGGNEWDMDVRQPAAGSTYCLNFWSMRPLTRSILGGDCR